MKYNCSTCTGVSPCCWENPATYIKVAEGERRVGWTGEPTVCPDRVTWRWRLRWWPIWIHVTRTSVKVYWFVLAKAHKGLHP